MCGQRDHFFRSSLPITSVADVVIDCPVSDVIAVRAKYDVFNCTEYYEDPADALLDTNNHSE